MSKGPRRFPIFRTGALCAWVLMNAPFTMAQTSSSVDAFASISEKEATLALESGRNLMFGQVYRPTAGSDATCVYTLGDPTHSERGYRAASYRDSSGTLHSVSGEDNPGCYAGFADFPNPHVSSGGLTLGCDVGSLINFAVTYENGGLQGVNLFSAGNLSLNASFVGLNNRVTKTNLSNTETESRGSFSCEELTLNIWVGGTLEVDETAALSSLTNVGTLTLDVSY